MDTLYQLLEWNPVQVGSTFQGGGSVLKNQFQGGGESVLKNQFEGGGVGGGLN